MNRIAGLLVSLSVLVVVAACGGMASDDPTLYLTGTEEQPLSSASGPVCPPTKVLICHIPPGNPANAHTICVGKPAERAHVAHHGDGVGACGSTPGDEPEDPPPPPPPAPSCLPQGAECEANPSGCCEGLTCTVGAATPVCAVVIL